MKTTLHGFILTLVAWTTLPATADTRYVDLSSPSPTPPYINWVTAATNIQDAIDVAVAGDNIMVTNGVYNTGARDVAGDSTSNRVAITKAILVQSVNGPDVTVIEGYQVPGSTNGPGAVRCVSLANGARLAGFTLTNGATVKTTGYGGGLSFQYPGTTTTAIVSNCVLTGNSADTGGGGAVGGGTLINCTLSNNYARLYGGGVYQCVLEYCVLTGNTTKGTGGGTYNCTLISCILTGNSATNFGGGAYAGSLTGCTIVGNLAGQQGGGVDEISRIANCIIYFNRVNSFDVPLFGVGSNHYGSSLSYTSTAPLPAGVGNITNAPLFFDQAGEDYRLQSNSPCINSGRNASTSGTNDLDGNPRIVSATVDMGAYEYQGSGSLISYAWLQQYGLPLDGSVDAVDADDDGMTNYGEWRSDTSPTNALSVLQMVSATNSPTGAKVTWQSVSTRSYWLERATNLGDALPFQSIAPKIAGASSSTTYTDTGATNGGPYFYRVGVLP